MLEKQEPVSGILIPKFVATALMSLLILAFTAWAGVLWTTGNNTLLELRTLSEREKALREELKEHQLEPWHSKAGEELREISSQQRVILLELRQLHRQLNPSEDL